jgi:hypothetical protein
VEDGPKLGIPLLPTSTRTRVLLGITTNSSFRFVHQGAGVVHLRVHVTKTLVPWPAEGGDAIFASRVDAHQFYTGWRWPILTPSSLLRNRPKAPHKIKKQHLISVPPTQPVVQLYLPGTDPTPS